MDEFHHVLTNASYIRNTLCGAPISVSATASREQVDRRATFGGLVKLGASNSDFKLFGLTVDHVFAPTVPHQSKMSDDVDDSDSDDTDDSDDAFVAEYESFKSLTDLADLTVADTESHMPPILQDPLGHSLYGTGLGEHLRIDASVRCNNLDFALIEIDPAIQLRPNRLRPGEFEVEREADLSSPPADELFFKGDRDVAINVSSNTRQLGTLIALPCSIWIDGVAGFVQAHPLQMSIGSSKSGYVARYIFAKHVRP